MPVGEDASIIVRKCHWGWAVRSTTVFSVPLVARRPGAVQMIAIRIVSRAGVAVRESPAASFGEAGGLIGRGEDCALVLPDAERHISRRQVRISNRDGRYFMRVLSTSTPVKADGAAVPVDIDHPIE